MDAHDCRGASRKIPSDAISVIPDASEAEAGRGVFPDWLDFALTNLGNKGLRFDCRKRRQHGHPFFSAKAL